MNEFKITRAKFSDYKEILKPLIEKHWNEVGMPGAPNLKLDFNISNYEDLEKSNSLLSFVIKDQDVLVGYLSIAIHGNYMHQTKRFATTDGFFIDKKYRGRKSAKALIKMFLYAEAILRDEFKVNYFTLHCNASNDLPFLAQILEFKKSSILYTKEI